MDTLEIIRELEHDEALRASLRAMILGDELLSLPDQMRLLTTEVQKLVEAQKQTTMSIHRLEENVGEVSEESCAAVLGAMAYRKGWTVLDNPGLIDIGKGEVDVRGRFDTPIGGVAILAETKSRLRGSHVSKWASRVGGSAWREQFLYPGFEGQVLPYVYGTIIYDDAFIEAERLGIGVIGPGGERVAPRPL
ncbi:MAG: hypothetical protein M1399_07275 [Actinobacteria bacterium]|nr:hypothetical protein [Actinomycetota bacterium]MCL5446670.1 hypothetical protein [Actinomycetota bacterium]